MAATCTQLFSDERFQSVILLKIDALYVPKKMIGDNRSGGVNSRCSVKGYDWEICLYPSPHADDCFYLLALELVLVGKHEDQDHGDDGGTGSVEVTANLSGKIADSGGCYIHPYDFPEQKNVPKEFRRPLDRSNPFYIGFGGRHLGSPDRLSLTVECTITVFFKVQPPEAIIVPPSNLSRHLGELLRSQAGADVTFSVCGESIAAHKSVLATRSPVFMAEFFGEMMEKDAQLVEILEMDAQAFKAMLHFIYTDAAPELDQKPEAEAMSLAQHLIVAADRYGLDRLKVMCERRLARGVDVSTVALTLAIAEQQNCSRLKAKCIDFIAGGSEENISAVLATDGYKHLCWRKAPRARC
jgi:speckle-type POZ protein